VPAGNRQVLRLAGKDRSEYECGLRNRQQYHGDVHLVAVQRSEEVGERQFGDVDGAFGESVLELADHINESVSHDALKSDAQRSAEP
jgi:ribosomal protein S30